VPRHIRPFGLIALVVTIAFVVATGPAGADPLADAMKQAATLQSQIAANNVQLDALGQQYDGAQLRLQQAQQTIAVTQAKIAADQAQLGTLRAKVRARAVTDYQSAIDGESLNALDVSDAQQLLVGQKYAAAQAAVDNSLIGQLNTAKQALDQQEATAQKAQSQAASDVQQLASTKANLAAATAQQQATLNQVQGQLVLLVAQAQQQAAAAALSASGGGGDPGAYPNLPPVSPLAAQAIAFARAQIGKPYLYAAAGPDSYDCSGLVMAAFASAGFQLPHYSGAQYAMLPHIPIGSAQPGDLLFWGEAASEHVAIYVGDGRILEAGGTGNDVHIGPIWGQPMGAARVP
jgi:cell wall-associated NlpC family hydrolase